MRVCQAVCILVGWSAVAAFVPSGSKLHAPFSKYLSCVASATPDSRKRISAARTSQSGTVEQATCTSTATSAGRRAVAPIVLVGSDSVVLGSFAQHLSADRSSCAVIDLSEIAKQDGPRAVEKLLHGTKDEGVLVCPVDACLGYPELNMLVSNHPLTVQLAVEGEDAAARSMCEKSTKYTVVVGAQSQSNVRDGYAYAKEDLARLVAFARKPKPSKEDIALDMGKNTFFLSLTFPDFTPHVDLLPDLSEAVDAMELRVDLLADHDPYSVLKQLSILRRHTGYLPVVFTVRSKGQCGAFPDDADALFRLARWGLRAGAEVMDVEANWPMSYREALIEEARKGYPGAVMVGSYHVVGKKTTEEQARKLFAECYHSGAVDAVKVWFCHV